MVLLLIIAVISAWLLFDDNKNKETSTLSKLRNKFNKELNE